MLKEYFKCIKVLKNHEKSLSSYKGSDSETLKKKVANEVIFGEQLYVEYKKVLKEGGKYKLFI